jgi:hypothetical protein
MSLRTFQRRRDAGAKPLSQEQRARHRLQPDARRLVTCARTGRLEREYAGMRSTTPAFSRSGALARGRDASAGCQQRVEDFACVDHGL